MVKSNVNAIDLNIPSWLSCYLNQQDVQDIEAAISRAEHGTSGEIVPLIVRGNDFALSPRLFLMVVFFLIYAVIIERMLLGWESPIELALIGIGGLVFAAIGFGLPRFACIRRIITANVDARRSAEIRAELEFYRAGIGSTSGNTGILLLLSIEDHQAVVLADKGISEKLPPATWDELLQMMLRGVKSKKCAAGMIQAISKCGDILAQHFPKSQSDENELTNHLRILD